MSVVAERYADALFESAGETQAVSSVREGLVLVGQLLHDMPQLAEFIRNPEISLAEKESLLRDSLGKALPPLGLQFVLLLVRKQRFTDWAAIHAAFEERYRQSQRLERAVVRSARPLDPALLKQIDAALERWRGTQIDLVTEIDPRLLGGVQVRIGSQLIDGSVRSQLDIVAQQLKTTPVN